MTIESTTLQTKIERYFAAGADAAGDPGAMDAFLELRSASKRGPRASRRAGAGQPCWDGG